MPLLPPNHHRSGRAPLALFVILIVFIAAPLLLIGAAPQWWGTHQIYQMESGSAAPSSDYSPANLGQLKHFAVSAYEYLHSATGSYGDTTAPVPESPVPALQKGGIGWRLRESLGQFVEFNTAPGGDISG